MNEESIMKEIYEKIKKQNEISASITIKNEIKCISTTLSQQTKVIPLFSKKLQRNISSKNENYKRLSIDNNVPIKSKEAPPNKKILTQIKESILAYNAMQKNRSPQKMTSKILSFKSTNNKKKHFHSISSVSFLKSRFNKYDVQAKVYKISNEYSKVECYDKSFLERMEFYSTKSKLKQEKIEEALRQLSPKLPEEQRIEAFNRLISDSNRRVEAKNRIIQAKSNKLISNRIFNKLGNNSSLSKSMSQNRWDKLYKERFATKYKDYPKLLAKKLNEKRIKDKVQQLDINLECENQDKTPKITVLNTNPHNTKNWEAMTKTNSSQRTTVTNHKNRPLSS